MYLFRSVDYEVVLGRVHVHSSSLMFLLQRRNVNGTFILMNHDVHKLPSKLCTMLDLFLQ